MSTLNFYFSRYIELLDKFAWLAMCAFIRLPSVEWYKINSAKLCENSYVYAWLMLKERKKYLK